MSTKQKKQDKISAAGGKGLSGTSALPMERPSSKVQELIRYFENARTELGKVSWPTQREVKVTSIAVLVLVVVMSFFLGIVDLLLAKIMQAILSKGM